MASLAYQVDSNGYLYVTPNPPTGSTAAQTQGTVASGSASVGNPVAVGGQAAGANGASVTMAFLQQDQAKNLFVNPEGQKATYMAAFQVTPAASATDIAELIGSGTKIVKVTRVAIWGLATAAAIIDVLAIKRSAVDTGGTITSQTAVNVDNTDAVATAVAYAITANPTQGATGSKYGTIKFGKCDLVPAASTTLKSQGLVWEFGPRSEKSLTLRGAADALCINLNGVQSTGQVMNIEFTWTEE